MNVILGNRDIANRKLGNLQYFDVPAGAFPVPWNEGKECTDAEKCSKNSMSGRFEGVSVDEYLRRQKSSASMGFTKQELIVPVGGGVQPGWLPVSTGYWPGPAYVYPVTTPTQAPAAAASESNGISTKTILIGGAIVVAGLFAVMALSRK